MPPEAIAPRFGFVVHPLTELQRRLLGIRTLDAGLALRGSSRRGARVVAHLDISDPFGARATGTLVSIPALPDELLADQARGVELVSEAVALCHAQGAAVVGLGAVAAVIGGQGKAVAAQAPCPITTGNGMTAWAAGRTVAMVRRRLGLSGPVSLIGPPGPVANGLLQLLVRGGSTVLVVAERPPRPLQALIDRLNADGPGTARCVASVEAARAETPLLVAASSTGGRIRLSTLAAGSVVVDVAQPLDVIHDVQRDDVLLLDGEYVRLPRHLAGGFWHRVYGMVTGQGRHIFACFAEPMLFALAGDASQRSVGRDVPVERLDAIADRAAAHGFFVDRLHSDGRVVAASRLARFSA